MYEKFGQFINGKWSPSSNGETYEVINPATEEILGKASKASSVDVDRALKSSEQGLQVWKKITPWQRAYILRKIADKIREKKDILAKRDKGNGKYENWFAYGRNQSLEKLKHKLFFPHITPKTPNFVESLDENLLFYNGLALIGENERDLLFMKKTVYIRPNQSNNSNNCKT